MHAGDLKTPRARPHMLQKNNPDATSMSIPYVPLVPGMSCCSSLDAYVCLEVGDYVTREFFSLPGMNRRYTLVHNTACAGCRWVEKQFSETHAHAHTAAWNVRLEWWKRDGCFSSRRSHLQIFHAQNSVLHLDSGPLQPWLSASDTWKIPN